jgi:hypothetical protein
MEIRVYINNASTVSATDASANSDKKCNTRFRKYDNGLRVGECIDNEWYSYERIFQKNNIEIRKIIDSDPELHYLNIETEMIEFKKINNIIFAGTFIQWPIDDPIPTNVPAEFHSEIVRIRDEVKMKLGNLATIQKVPEPIPLDRTNRYQSQSQTQYQTNQHQIQSRHKSQASVYGKSLHLHPHPHPHPHRRHNSSHSHKACLIQID